ncbi:hypothetical protein N8T08_000441 [Aspergillus melleus]|uniref:Uncharacterized protein n=1 Tax=Aspergillus melleus TaxID=138277 RepID=A0ACC3BCC9_9EURO|nr:hypothetical protein N8T08_000441 [Aspergillus melleus]
MGGLTLTTIENEAKQFLRELHSIRSQPEKNGRRAIIFVAYDFGAILVKTALSLARKSGKENDEIFYCTAAIVFSRCPQRNSDIETLERTVFDFLIGNKRAKWLPLITLPAVRGLARAVRTSTNAFVGSKITLRCRVISIYTGEVLSHSAFGQYTATLGLPSEFVIEEQEDGSLPGLIQSIAHSPQCWIPHPLGIPWERFLLAVSSAHCQSQQMPFTEPQWPGVEPVAFVERFSAREPQILYLYGKDPRVARNIADQVAWKLRANDAQLVSFVFDSMDPLRDSIADFIASALCQVYIGRDTGFVHQLYCVLQDQYLIHDGWTDNSLLSTFEGLALGHTGWPRSLSFQSLSKYIMILETIEPNNSTAQIVDRALRSHATDDGFYWILTWLVGSARPLSHVELTTLLCKHYAMHSGNHTITKHGLSDFERAWQQLVTWFNGIASFDQEHVTFILQFRDIIFNNDLDQSPYLWYEARQNAHQTITDFCLNHLTSPDTLQKFGPLLEDYLDETSRQHQENTISPPMVGDEEDIGFYVIQFLPFHLVRCSHEYTTATIDRLLNASSLSTLWARLHWAMTNPLSRPPEAYKSKSALPVLAGLGLLPCERLSNASDEKDFILLAAAYGNQGHLVRQLLQEFQYSLSALIYCLRGALADILLRAGAETDPNRDKLGLSGYIPSPLFLATRLGHASTVRVLLDQDARIDVVRHDDLPLMAVASRDQTVIEEFLAKDRSYLKSDLVFAYAVSGGAWECIPRFAAQNCDFNALLSEFPLTDRPMTPLVLACLYKYPRTVSTLLNHGADPDLPGPWCPLWLATIWAPNTKSLRHLLQHGANPNSDRLNLPLLLDLVSSPLGVREIRLLGDILLENHPPLEINALDPGSGRSALMQACFKGQLPIVTWLLDHGANAGVLDHNKESALHYAIRGKHPSVVRQILTSRPWLATIDQANEPLLNLAIPSLEICSLLLDAGADPMCYNHRGQAPMNYAAMAGSSEILQMLIERGVNLDHRDSWGWTVICDAVLYGKDVSTLSLLIESGSDLAVRTWTLEQTLLHLAVYGSPEVFKVLLEHTKSLSLDARDIYTNTPLLSAESNANIHCLTLLVNVGANINLINERGDTALHNSFYSDMPAFRDLLLSQTDLQINVSSVYSDEGADPQSAHPGSGTLPIHFAAANGVQNFQLILQSYRCDVKATDHYGKGCLHWAAQFGKARTIAFLLSQIPPKKDRELALAQADKDGWTPLCWAMRPFSEDPDYGTMSEPADYLETVRLLLDNGADPTVHCYWGELKLTSSGSIWVTQ